MYMKVEITFTDIIIKAYNDGCRCASVIKRLITLLRTIVVING